MGIEQKEQTRSQVAPLLPPYRKLRLKGIDNRGGLAQQTSGLLAAVRVSPQRDTSLEVLVPPARRENDQNHGLERDTQGNPLLPPYQKLRLKGVDNRGGLAQESSGLLTAVRVSPERETPLEGLILPPHRENDQNYYAQMVTFDCSEIPVSAIKPLGDGKDSSARWKILVVLVAILVASLIFIGIFGAYLLRPAFLHYVHLFVH